MSKQPRFELVRSDAGWFARFIAASGREVWRTSETYTRRQGAKEAVASMAQAFTLTPAGWTFRREQLHVTTAGTSVAVREVDERGSGA